jgi:hypothetical protein
MKSARRRNRGAALTENGRAWLIAWMGRRQPTRKHAEAMGIDHAILCRLAAGKRIDKWEKVAEFSGFAAGELFDLRYENSGPIGSARERGMVRDVVAALTKFDSAANIPERLHTLSRDGRGQFLTDIEALRGIVDELRHDDSPATAEVVTQYYLTAADQFVVSPTGESEALLAGARTRIGCAIDSANRTASPVGRILHATCLLHDSSFAAAQGDFVAARSKRSVAQTIIANLHECEERNALMARLLGDAGRQLTEEDEFEEAARCIREANDFAAGLSDSYWKGCCEHFDGVLSLRKQEPERAVGQLTGALGVVNQSNSKHAPFQKVVFSKYLAVAQAAMGDSAEAEKTRSQAIKDCDDYGFVYQRDRIRRLRTSRDGRSFGRSQI